MQIWNNGLNFKREKYFKQYFGILDFKIKLSKKSNPRKKNTASYMAEPYKCHEIEIMNSNSLRGNFK